MVTRRIQPGRTLTMPTPVVVAGQPIVPLLLGELPNTGTVKKGPGHLRALQSTDPDTAGSSVHRRWSARWSVHSLPDPAHYGGFYWLGDNEAIDGTAGLPLGARGWAPSSGHGPTWASHYPFKPSVQAVDHYLFGGDVVHHPRGVNFNRHYLEHMWADWGRSQRQPFTWMICGMVTGWHRHDDEHYLLDAGRNPRRELTTAQERDLWRSHALHRESELGYRSMLAITQHDLRIRTRSGAHQVGRVHTGAALRPKVFVGIFDGPRSHVGVLTPDLRRINRVTLDDTAAQHHRYYLLGRGQGSVSQERTGSLLLFEMRFFNFALDVPDLHRHYREMAGDYHFRRYDRG